MGGAIGKAGKGRKAGDFQVKMSSGPISAHFKLGEDIGAGRYATCRSARCVVTGEEVAVKILFKRHKQFDAQRALQEIAILQGLKHPNCVDMIACFEDELAIYMVQELVSGGELLDRIAELETFSEANVADVIAQLLDVVAYIHSMGICHRDIKPSNILLMSDDPDSPNYTRIKLCDFGLAHRSTQVALWACGGRGTAMTSLCGTPIYMAPEIAAGVFKNSQKSKSEQSRGSDQKEKEVVTYTNVVDVWSVGVILYVMMSGYQPFFNWNDLIGGDCSFDFPEWDDVSAETKEFICFCLEKDPKKRPTALKCLNHPWIMARELRSSDNLTSRSALMSGSQNFSIKWKIMSALSTASGASTFPTTPCRSGTASPKGRSTILVSHGMDHKKISPTSVMSPKRTSSFDISKSGRISPFSPGRENHRSSAGGSILADAISREYFAASGEEQRQSPLLGSEDASSKQSSRMFPRRSEKSDSWIATSRSSSPVRRNSPDRSAHSFRGGDSATTSRSHSRATSPHASPKLRAQAPTSRTCVDTSLESSMERSGNAIRASRATNSKNIHGLRLL